MAGPIYKCILGKYTEAFHQLTEDERKKVVAKDQEILKKVGGKSVFGCYTAWATEQYEFFGIEEFPDIEAAQKASELEAEIRRYFDCQTTLGVAWEKTRWGAA